MFRYNQEINVMQKLVAFPLPRKQTTDKLGGVECWVGDQQNIVFWRISVVEGLTCLKLARKSSFRNSTKDWRLKYFFRKLNGSFLLMACVVQRTLNNHIYTNQDKPEVACFDRSCIFLTKTVCSKATYLHTQDIVNWPKGRRKSSLVRCRRRFKNRQSGWN